MNMKRLFMWAALALAALSASSCLIRINEKALREDYYTHSVKANGDLVTQIRPLDEAVRFYRHLGSGDFVFVQRDTTPYLEVTASENIISYFYPEFSLPDGMLTCRFSSDSIANVIQGYVKIVLYAPDLEGIELIGSGDALVEGLVRPGDFSAVVTGSGDMHLKGLECDNLNVSVAGSGDVEIVVNARGMVEAGIAGSGDIRLIGSADRAKFSVAGSGDINARGLKVANDVSSSTRGSGDIKL